MSKVWLITGASRGFGRASTEEALKAGHRVVDTAAIRSNSSNCWHRTQPNPKSFILVLN